jgi:hypothetical protein
MPITAASAVDPERAVLLLGHRRAQRRVGREREQHRDREHDDRHPHPRPRANLGEALAQLGGHRTPDRRLAARAGAHAGQERGGDDERRGVGGERPAGAEAQHQRGGQRGADELRQRLERARRRTGRLDHRFGHGLGHQAGVRGPEERLGGPE